MYLDLSNLYHPIVKSLTLIDHTKNNCIKKYMRELKT